MAFFFFLVSLPLRSGVSWIAGSLGIDSGLLCVSAVTATPTPASRDQGAMSESVGQASACTVKFPSSDARGDGFGSGQRVGVWPARKHLWLSFPQCTGRFYATSEPSTY
ncbi:hypothetical protein BaRGS_00001271 [Batillaria attramentaria]|uniref:Secreted protein n=1 Tax=Batillaria attramentaria TaxID=370345 RepID=A0ABD0M7B7_9CAEN